MLYYSIPAIAEEMGCTRQWVWQVVNENPDILDHPGVLKDKPLCCTFEVAEIIKEKIIEKRRGVK